MLEYSVIFFVAIITSTISAIVGLGGGLLLIPFIILLFSFPLKIVAGTMLVAMVPYTMVASIKNYQQKYIAFKIGLIMEAGSVVGVIVGANFTRVIPDIALKIFFISVVIYLMLTLKIPKNSPYNYVARAFKILSFLPPHAQLRNDSNQASSISALIIIGMIAGLFSGMLGIGGGFLKTPVLLVGIGLPAKLAVGTALFMIMITASFGAATHIYLGDVNLILALIITAGMIIGAWLGSSILNKQPDERVKKYIFYAMFLAGILTLFK